MSPAPAPPIKLRSPLDARPIQHAGRPYLMLRDPLGLTSKTLLIPHELAPALGLLDGNRDAETLRGALAVRFGLRLPPAEIEALINSLDQALFLENEHFAEAYAQALDDYRRARYRPLSCAPSVYPAEPAELKTLLDGWLDETSPVHQPPAPVRGLVSPHIDYERGGPVYAAVWRAAAEAANEADLAVIFGTDHYGGEQRFSLTRQHYATPYGILPTPGELVDKLSRAIGTESAFRGELHHLGEHSVELAAVWLHHLRQGRPVELLPVLIGSFASFIQSGADPSQDPAICSFLETLHSATQGRQVLYVAAADLAHVGPAFGGAPVDDSAQAALQAADQELITAIAAGQAGSFITSLQRVQDRNNVCGIAPIYMTLAALAPTRGQTLAYDHCPADSAGTSLVSICGALLY